MMMIYLTYKLIKITYPDRRVVRFGYDGLGRRVWRQDGNLVRYFYYDGERVIAEREGNSWVVRYLLGLRLSGFVANGQVRVYHADRLGSIRWVWRVECGCKIDRWRAQKV